MCALCSDNAAPSELITVVGHGEIVYQPDIAYINLGAEGIYDNASLGQKEISSKINTFIDAIALLIDKRNIETTALSISRRMEYINQKNQFVGYDINQQLRIKLSEFDLLGGVVDKAVQAGLNAIGGIVFDSTSPSKYKQLALAEAVKGAKQKIQIIASNLGLQDLRVVSIEEQPQVSPGPRIFLAEASLGAEQTSVMPQQLKTSAEIVMKCSYLRSSASIN